VDACFAGLFYDNTTLAHQMPLASAVRHITVIEKGKRPRFLRFLPVSFSYSSQFKKIKNTSIFFI
jgi:hypothetical protein